jgi:hypothetical protein
MSEQLKTITNNINKMTNKEKITFIETLLGVSVTIAEFLIDFQIKCPISLPPDIHYMMLIALANINALSQKESTAEIMDFSIKTDSYEDKLICILKQLNEIYKDKIK